MTILNKLRLNNDYHKGRLDWKAAFTDFQSSQKTNNFSALEIDSLFLLHKKAIS